MRNNARLTVLMPVYNAEKFLRAAIDSILIQTFRDFEFLIVDDGSTDSSREIINSYSDPRIRLIRNVANSGVAETLNKGIELASTELIARMDADDVSRPLRLQKQYDYFRQNPECALLSTWAQETTEDGAAVRTNRWRSVHYFYNLTFHCWIYHPTVMYRRSAVVDAGKYQLRYCEDYDLWWKISRKYKINNLEEVLLDYRLSETGISRVARKEENETDQSRLVRRNIEYYANGAFDLSDDELEFLQNNCAPLLQKNDLKAIARCFQKLDSINENVLKTENINCDPKFVAEAARDKKQTLIEILRGKLPKRKLMILLMMIGERRTLAGLPLNYISKRIGFKRRGAESGG